MTPGPVSRVEPVHWARNVDLQILFDSFLVAAVTAILVNRALLFVLGYPQVGGRGLHIAHLLWGGLLMLLAFLSQLFFLGRRRQLSTAVVGGIGFGLFIDELGKFITSDNNYFFRPTAALVYVIFVLLYLAARALEPRGRLSPREYVANVLDVVKDGAIGDIDADELSRASQLLALSGETEWSAPLENLLNSIARLPQRPPSRFATLGRRLRDWYEEVVETRAFQRFTIMVFVLQAFFSLAEIVGYPGSLLGCLAQGFRERGFRAHLANVYGLVIRCLVRRWNLTGGGLSGSDRRLSARP